MSRCRTFVEVEGTTDGQKAFAICRSCFVANKKPLVHGQKKKTTEAGSNNMIRKRAKKTDRGSTSKKKKGTTPVPSWATAKKTPDPKTSSTAQTPNPKAALLPPRWHPPWLVGETRLRFAFSEEVERFGKIEDVMGDGNCGFYAALLGLERMKRIEQKTITEFRKDLWEFASANQTQIKTVAIPEGQRNAIGKTTLGKKT
jgi:CDGSH-type Zn-finger protein